jgi:alkaline phosphatase
MFADATPACFVAHAPRRSNREQIVQQMVNESSVDVIMGGGNPLYSADAVLLATPESFANVGGMKTWEDLKAGKVGGDADGDGVPDPWKVVETRKGFQELMSGPVPKRVLGAAPTSSTLKLQRSGDPQAPPFSVPFVPAMPTLAELTAGALNVLDDDPDGLFLMVEGGAIDWAGHANLSGRLVEEVVAFNEAIQTVVDWIQSHGGWEKNLLIITADHETGHLTGPGANPEYKPIVCNGQGILPGMEWHITKHTNSQVPFLVKGAGSGRFQELADQNDPVRGPYLDNAEVGQALLELAGKPTCWHSD